MTDHAEDKRLLAAKLQHGGQRPGAGRPEVKLKKGEKRRAVWIYATASELKAIKRLSPHDRKQALLVIAQQLNKESCL